MSKTFTRSSVFCSASRSACDEVTIVSDIFFPTVASSKLMSKLSVGIRSEINVINVEKGQHGNDC